MKKYDITFIGHMCFDEIEHYNKKRTIAPGSAVLCGALAAKKVGKKVLVITKMAIADKHIIKPMENAGIDVHIIPSKETTYMKVIHNKSDIDQRKLYQLKNAGFFVESEIPTIDTKMLHLAGITDQEFNIDFIKQIKERNYSLSTDMQSFIRKVNKTTKKIDFVDVENKKNIISSMDRIKLDMVEAKILTKKDNIEDAAKEIESLGCSEIVITHHKGVLGRVDNKSYYIPFTNKSEIGRTGRGDTTFGAYMARRITHNPLESLKFASSLVSIKMESLGPFSGNINDVLRRMDNS